MKKFRLTPQNLNLLLAIGGLLIFVAVYFLVFQNFSAKNEELDSQISSQTQYLSQLEEYNANIDEYENGIVAAKNNINKLIARLPVDVQVEDLLMYMKDFTESLGIELPSVSFAALSPVSEFSTTVNDTLVNVIGYTNAVSLSASMTYEQLKDFIQIVYEESRPVMYLDSVTLSYDSTNAKLSVSTSLSRYTISYEGAQYNPYPIPDVDIGTANPFNTTSVQ